MCQFEDWPIISRYTRQQAVDDGVLVDISKQYAGMILKKVAVTQAVRLDLTDNDIQTAIDEYIHWVRFDKPCLPEEDQLFHTGIQGKTIWVMEDDEAITVMYPSDY